AIRVLGLMGCPSSALTHSESDRTSPKVKDLCQSQILDFERVDGSRSCGNKASFLTF
ncbi:hypothetical protein RUM43_002938, partial [Polyplax serrata]